MRKWIRFNVNHPWLVLVLLLAITVAAGTGLKKLRFDSSTEALMPKDHVVYKIGERAKAVFTDSKTFILTAIEPVEGKTLFSAETFLLLNDLVTEIEEFKDFDLDRENKRLRELVELGNITVTKGEPLPAPSVGTAAAKIGGSEDDPDDEILGGQDIVKDVKQDRAADDPWDLDKPPANDFYVQAIRSRNKYGFENYAPVTLDAIREKLDPAARMQLDTILSANKLDQLKGDRKLDKEQFALLLESWEEIFLFKSMEIVKSFMNPISGTDIQGSGDELKPVDLVAKDENGVRLLPRGAQDFERYRETILRSPVFKWMLYSTGEKGDIRALALSITMRPIKDQNKIRDYFYQVLTKYDRGPVKLTPVGIPIFSKFITDYMRRDLKKFLPFVFLVIIVVFILNFRSPRGVLLPTMTLILGLVWTMGLMGLMGIPITIVVTLLPPLLIAIGSSYSIHIFNQYLHDAESIRKVGKKEGLLKSMSHISTTVLLAALTTFIGFMTLTANQVASLKHFGLFSAIGTLFAAAISIMLIPSALVMMKTLPLKKKSKKGKEKSADTDSSNFIVRSTVKLLSRLSVKRPGTVIVAAIIMVVIFSVGISMLKVESGPMFNFKESSYIYQSDMRIGELFKGSMAMNLVIDSGRADGAKDPGFLKLIEEIRRWLTSPEGQETYHHLHTFSFGDIIKRMHMAMNNDDPAYYTIPGEESTVRDYLEIYSGDDRDSDGRADNLEQFVDADYRYVNILLKIGASNGKLFTTSVNSRGRERIRDYMSAHPRASKYRWYLVGEPVNFLVLAGLLVNGLFLTILLTIVLVAFVIFLIFRSWKSGIVAVIPISASILTVYGIMGYLGIPLDIAKCILAAIALGVGVDDTIHMLKTLRFHLRKGLPLEKAMTETFKEAGMAIVYTSIALVAGFSVLMLSQFKPIFFLGWLIAGTMVATTIAALVLLPAVIVYFKLPMTPSVSSVPSVAKKENKTKRTGKIQQTIGMILMVLFLSQAGFALTGKR
ncbi:MAG: MMPL family transporter [bacterium]|nr:MMPL family transporter [bacterium]